MRTLLAICLALFLFGTNAHARVVSHPAGCPWRAFCGCGASLEVFGHRVRDLYLARNWFKFPRASPAPGMVAVRRHHVMVIRQVTGPRTAIVYDANSGGHRTRIHERSLRGYTIVNPHGSRQFSARRRHRSYRHARRRYHRRHHARYAYTSGMGQYF